MLVSFKPPTVDDNLLGVPLESSSRLLVLDGHPSAVGRAVRGLFAGVIRSLPCSWLAVGSGGACTHGAWENADECRVRGTAPPACLTDPPNRHVRGAAGRLVRRPRNSAPFLGGFDKRASSTGFWVDYNRVFCFFCINDSRVCLASFVPLRA